MRTSAPAENKSTQSDSGPKVRLNPDGFPVGIPGPHDLRLTAAWLESIFPLTDLPELVKRREYTLAHELSGAYDAIQEMRTLATELEEFNRRDPEGIPE
jgi:hypothetical protein